MDSNKKIGKYFRRHSIPEGSHILIACSGGVDSIVLLHRFTCLQAEGKYSISSAYLDHGIRPRSETDADIQFLKQFSDNLHVPFFYKRIKEGKLHNLAKQQKRSLEEIAREKRYLYLFKLKRELKAQFLALGHTLDDHLETLTMQFFQGAGAWGLTGIPEKRGFIIRPLFFCSRSDNLEYINAFKLSYREDLTNLTEDYLRNRVRLRLLPVIKQVFPGYATALLSLSEKMRLTKNFLDNEQNSRTHWQKKIQKTAHTATEKISYQTNAIDFFSNPGIIRLCSLYAIFDAIKKDGKDSIVSTGTETLKKRLPYRFLAPLLGANTLEIKKTTNKPILLKGFDIKLSKKGNTLFLERDIVDSGKKGYFIVVDEQQKTHIIGDREITIKVVKAISKMDTSHALFLNLGAVMPPLIIRSKRAGDKIALKTGKKSLKKIYNEWGIPVDDRWLIPVIADKKSILGILGKPFGYQNRLNEPIQNENKTINQESKLLRVEVK
jgi:tRNA(Ile)-lysidine synthase